MAKNLLGDLSAKDGLDDSSLLRTLIDSLPEHVYVKDAEGRYVLSNVAHVKALGAASPEEVAGKSDFDFYPKELAERYCADEQEIISSGQPLVNKEEPSVDEEGNERWHSTTKVPLRDGNGEIVGLVGMTRDVTERKEAEEKLRESEDRFRSLTDATFEGIAITENGEILEANQAFAEMYGYELSEVRGMSALEFQAPETRDEVWRKISSGFSKPYESVGLKKDGTTFDVEIRGKTTWYGDRFVRVTAIRDITERKRAEEKLRESERRFRSLIQNTSDLITVLESDGTIRYKSPAVERILGYEEEEILGTTVFDYVHPEDVEDVRRTFAAALESPGFHPPVQFRFRCADGSWRHMEAIRNNLLDDPNVQGIVVNTRDITERKETEEALRKSETSLAEAQRIAHLGNWEWDVKAGEMSWSDEVFRLYGYQPKEFVPTYDKLLEGAHPDDREQIRKNRDGALYEGEPYDFEHRIVRSDGEERVVRCRAEVVFDEEDEPLRMIGTVHDITEHKEAEEALRESEERYRTVVEQSMEGIWLFDPDTKQVLESNAAFQEMLGYTAEELQEMTNYDFVTHSRENIDSAVQQVVQEGRGYFGERKYRRKDGAVLDVEVSGTVIPYKGREVVCAVTRDLTERKQAEEVLKESEERFRTAFEDAPIGVALTSLEKRYLRVNRALCEMLGYSEEELLEKTTPEVTHPDDRETSTAHVRQTLEGETETFTLERRFIHADGHVVWILSSVSLIRDSQDNPSHFVCLYQDITERKELEERLQHQAFHDSLTELPNRALFLDRLEHALARARRKGGPVALLLVDLDDFKVINDSLGHDAGNAVLVEVAERLRNSVRPGDTVGRLFGDEFVVLLEAPSGVEEARRVTERITERLREPFGLNGQEMFVVPSIGIALGESAEDEPKEVLRHADLAMYAAKRHGKAQYEVYNPSMDTRVQERMNLKGDLRRAVECEEFEVYYQPKVELRNNEIVGVEALVRWKHPDRGLLPAAQFISLAEETGLIDQIGLWVLKESCRQVKEWQERYPAKLDPPLSLCVNLSAREIQQSDLAEKIATVLRETGLDAHSLTLEISERTAMQDVEYTIGKLRELKDLGVELALDDFGTGYCSLVYLEHSLLDILKIDRLFVQREKEDPEEWAVAISAVLSMARSLGLETIVEGVETEEQLAKLKELGCDLAQGYYFAEPLPSDDAERLLEEGVS